MKDLILDKNYQIGSKGAKVGLIQEWLNLHGFGTPVDGEFGVATAALVKAFQREKGLEQDGVVGPDTFGQLVLPMKRALRDIDPAGKPLGRMVVAYAEQHAAEAPREVGGQNRGPWVRLYMKGNEGANWPWCAGFACFVLDQACRSLDIKMPLTPSFSCDYLAATAKTSGILLQQPKGSARASITPGSFFLVKRTPTDWSHVGIVAGCEQEIFHTIEGNTNDEGSREGYEVCKRVRNYEKKDFILI